MMYRDRDRQIAAMNNIVSATIQALDADLDTQAKEAIRTILRLVFAERTRLSGGAALRMGRRYGPQIDTIRIYGKD